MTHQTNAILAFNLSLERLLKVLTDFFQAAKKKALSA